MNDELPQHNRTPKTLDERFAKRPYTYRRLQQIADQMDQAIANGATADEAEGIAMEQIQKLGGEMLQDWAEAKQQQALRQAQSENPQSIKHIKKK